MKWHSNLFEVIPLVEGEVNVIAFADLEKQFAYRQLVKSWSAHQRMDYPFCLLTIEGREVAAKELNILSLQGGGLEFFKDKHHAKQLIELMKFELENSPELLEVFTVLQGELEKAFEQCVVEFEGMELQPSTELISFEQLIKIAPIEVRTVSDEPMGAYQYQSFLLKSWLHLVHNKATNVCFYDFPENELNKSELKELFQFATSQACTMICLTTSPQVINQVGLSNVHLIKRTGERYSIETLHEELKLFFEDTPESLKSLAKNLAYSDLHEEYIMLDQKWWEFLTSRMC
ncbi:hypothetical protein A1A1_01393 [Planococcus antarcticus DSM 14505]|uniref:Uncharacterized protein n=1 Tax=Planococcus antarcticus DSM 14505 TaxID=1185653 RepID=A0A1C7DHW5_9BACL|nr:hypothetical protein [Planococcus antarcticus]ANU10861.1 hypothetical protein BBH88_11335 [Planococcus antarcticus DSM 14505]EIM08307.1 hypothetical protein A1A1_01393 [Planococcus antarcticus DSM 14505]